MRMGLYKKTKVLFIAIIAIMALLVTAAVGIGVSSAKTQGISSADNITVDLANTADGAKVVTVKVTELFGVAEGKKAYDGKTDISVKTYEESGVLEGEDARVGEITCTASGSDVGIVSLTYSATLIGDNASEYTVVINSDINNIEITKRSITLGNVVAAERFYDGSNIVALSGGELLGVLDVDKSEVGFSLDPTGTVENKNYGDRKAVTYSAGLTGSRAGNYELTTMGAVYANITKAPLTAVWGNLTFEYNKTQHRPNVTLQGMLDGEAVSAEAVYIGNDAADGVDVVVNGGYNVGLRLTGNDSGNYRVPVATARVIITPKIAVVEFAGGDSFIANVKLSDISASVTNAIDGDVVKVNLIQDRESRPGRYIAQAVSLNNSNYILPENPYIKNYIVRAPSVANFATTAKKLTIDIIDENNGFDPNMVFYVEKIDNSSNAVFDNLKKEEKFYASYKVRTTIDNQPVELNGTYKYSLTMPSTDKSEAKFLKVALLEGSTVKVLDLEIVDGKVTFEATNLLEISVAIVYAPIFVWLWVVLGVLAVVAVIIALWMILFYVGKRKLLFDPNGGEPVEGISAKFHQEIALPQTNRESYTFNGWFADKKLSKVVKIDKMPFWDTTVVAKWLDADGVPVPYVSGSTILPAARDVQQIAEVDNEIDKHNQEVLRTITLEVRGGLPIPTITSTINAPVELPIPDKSGDAFAGWYYDGKFKSEARIAVMPKKSITIYAKWASDMAAETKEPLIIKMDKSDKTRTITFDTRGGNLMENLVAVKKSKISIDEPIRSGETFAYWSTDSKNFDKKIDLRTMPTEDVKIYAVYASDLNPLGVAVTEEAKRNAALNEPIENKPFNPQAFKRVNGVPSAIDDKIDSLMFGKAVMPSSRPLIDQAKQYSNEQSNNMVEPAKPAVEVAKKAIIESVDAKEDKQSLQDKLLVKAILFNTRGGAGLKPLQAKMGAPIELPTPIKGESKFLGWYKDESLIKQCDFNKMPSKNTMLFAKWIEDATVQELFDSGLAEGGKNNQAFDDDQARIDKMFASEEKGIDDIVIQRVSAKKSSLLIDESKKNR